jgi:arginyl-tRNA synthetase
MFRAILTSRLQAAFTAAGIELPTGFTPNVVIASDTRYGDYQSNAAMVLAKQVKANPRALAEQIKAALQVDDLCEKITVDGPGFLNFTLSAPACLFETDVQAVSSPGELLLRRGSGLCETVIEQL